MTQNNFHTHLPIDHTWTLFLDRDGVINVENVGTYITNWEEFQFCEGALEGIRHLSGLFGTVVIVTNQRGVGRGIMSLDSLKNISNQMMATIAGEGGKVDRVYVCTAVSDEDHNRKPNVGMGIQAREDFPMIDFKRSVMVGNSLSDMEFGKRLAMSTVFLTTKHEPFTLPHDLIDEQYSSLLQWAESLHPEPVIRTWARDKDLISNP
jgi:D-glycero-D-manno-heptose 1,7-bisphosphate phosphatase